MAQIRLRPIGPGMMQQVQMQCDKCDGQGEIIDDRNKCKTYVIPCLTHIFSDINS